MAVANKTKYAILGVLSICPMSGYDFKKFSDGSIAHFWNENYARIYPVLKEMKGEGLVTKKTMQKENRPPRNVYSISAKGKKELDQWLLRPAEERRLREELLLKLFFSEKVPVEHLKGKIEAEKQKNQQYLEEYARIEHCLKTDEATRNAPGLPLWLSTINFGKIFRQGVIQWCEETIRSLEVMDKNNEDIQSNLISNQLFKSIYDWGRQTT